MKGGGMEGNGCQQRQFDFFFFSFEVLLLLRIAGKYWGIFGAKGLRCVTLVAAAVAPHPGQLLTNKGGGLGGMHPR